jgi:hypothetical protein
VTSEAHPIDQRDLLSHTEGAHLVAQALQLGDLFYKGLILGGDLAECPVTSDGRGWTPRGVAMITEEDMS